MWPIFRCHAPKSKDEALSILSEEEKIKVLAGGTDLLVELQSGKKVENLLDITQLSDLKWDLGSKAQLISPLSTHAEISDSAFIRENFPALFKACSLVGSPQIRNMGTIGGNIANASPAADSIPPLLIYDAELTLESKGDSRQVALASILEGPYRTGIRNHELITSIYLKPLKGFREGYKRLTIRDSLALSRLSVAYAIREEGEMWHEVRLAIGSLTPTPFRAEGFERAIGGQRKDRGLLEGALMDLVNTVREMAGERPTHRFKIPILKELIREVFGVRDVNR
ncbi:MAG: FAD binding domain-containing protein [Desulfatiglandales bacterium]